MCLPFKSLEEDFAFVRNCATADSRASALVALCKKWDLRAPECASEVAEIAGWIESSSDQLRQEVVFALCFFRPVSDYEWVGFRGWQKAETGSLHWISSALEICVQRADQLTRERIEQVASRLDRPLPALESFDTSHYPAFECALADCAYDVAQVARVLGHFAKLLQIPPLATKVGDHPKTSDLAAQIKGLKLFAATLRDACPGQPR